MTRESLHMYKYMSSYLNSPLCHILKGSDDGGWDTELLSFWTFASSGILGNRGQNWDYLFLRGLTEVSSFLALRRKQIQFSKRPVLYYLEFRMMEKSKNPVTLWAPYIV
jgi:hypothetical protein